MEKGCSFSNWYSLANGNTFINKKLVLGDPQWRKIPVLFNLSIIFTKKNVQDHS